MSQRKRYQFKFWMDANKHEESVIGAELDKRKAKREMKPTIQKALELLFALEQGDTELLTEEFPHIVKALAPEPKPEPSGSGGEGGGSRDVEAVIEKQLQTHMQRIEGLIMQGGAVPVVQGAPSQSPMLLQGSGTLLSGGDYGANTLAGADNVAFSDPLADLDFDDIELDVIEDTGTPPPADDGKPRISQSNLNLLEGLKKLQQMPTVANPNARPHRPKRKAVNIEDLVEVVALE